MYVVHTDDASQLTAVDRLPNTDWGRKVRLFPENDPQNHEFRAWNDRLPSPVDLTHWPPGAVVCFGVRPLVAWCKHSGVRLFTGDQGDCFGTERYLDTGNARLYRLLQAWSFDPSTGDAEPASGIVGLPTNIWVTNEVWHELNKALQQEDSDVQRISSRTTELTFVYVDVSDFSENKPGQQALIINSLVYIVDQKDFWRGHGAVVQSRIEAKICLGDGYIYVFKKAIDGAYFAAYLAQLVEALVAHRKGRTRSRFNLSVEFHFRMGVHVGKVYPFWDPGRNSWNYIGDGINGGNRVLNAIDKTYDDQVYISAQVRQAIRASETRNEYTRDLLANLHNRGRREVKHKRMWRVYEVAHTALCAHELPEWLKD